MSHDIAPVRSTGIGSWPGTDVGDAIKIAFAECPDLPYLPELPGRGPYAGLIGRSTALLADMAVDLLPTGWRLTDTSGREHRLALSTLRSDLDQLEEQAQGYVGPIKYATAGPWTLAASLERPRSDRLLTDRGARRDLGQSLAEGMAELVAEMTRRLPGTEPVVQLDEPLLPAVLAGGVATASGLAQLRTVERAEVTSGLRYVVERLADARVLVHCCAADPPVALLQERRGAGRARRHRPAVRVGLGRRRCRPGSRARGRPGCPADRPPRATSPDQVARRVMSALGDLGVEPITERSAAAHPGLRARWRQPRRGGPCPAHGPHGGRHRDRQLARAPPDPLPGVRAQ